MKYSFSCANEYTPSNIIYILLLGTDMNLLSIATMSTSFQAKGVLVIDVVVLVFQRFILTCLSQLSESLGYPHARCYFSSSRSINFGPDGERFWVSARKFHKSPGSDM
jgi:hypothetical protein